MNAITICVDMADLLRLTLPTTRRHFGRHMIVTVPRDAQTHAVARQHDCEVFNTDAFYRRGADFNKFLAMEEGLDALGREGWLCILDADIVIPSAVTFKDAGDVLDVTDGKVGMLCEAGKLFSPLRRLCERVPSAVPEEHTWWQYPVHRNVAEWAGYMQVFHASDAKLGPAPWHQTNWRHAGGADSFFQQKWQPADKIRFPFDVLHLGPSGVNWCGRVAEYADGTCPPDAVSNKYKVRDYVSRRRSPGKRPDNRFDHEKLPPG